jgi:C4-dicarboxylate transporter DctM subunit
MSIVVVFFAVFLLFLFIRVPVGISIMLGGVAALYAGGLKLELIPSALQAGLDSFPLLAIPAFIFAGDLMAQGGISAAIMDFLYAIFKRFRGCLGSVMVITSMLFGSLTGSALATVSAIGGIMVPQMTKNGYDQRYTTALLASSGFLGILIPPSVPGVIYAMMSGQRVTDVWMSTLIPGVGLGILYAIVNYITYGIKQPKAENIGVAVYGRDIITKAPKASVAFIMPVIIFGGVYGGIFTATEAGAVSAVYGLLAGWIIYPIFFKSKPDSRLLKTVYSSAVNSATIAILIASASVVGRMITMGGVTTIIANWMTSLTSSKIIFLLIVNLIFLLVGMFLEITTGVLLFTPILVPIAQAYGIDPVHFGAIMLVNLGIGLITPPFAANLFVACRITGCALQDTIKRLLPFFGVCVMILLVTTYVPQFSLFVVRMLH